MIRRDQMAGLAKALQWCAEQSGATSSILCSDGRDLQILIEEFLDPFDAVTYMQICWVYIPFRKMVVCLWL